MVLVTILFASLGMLTTNAFAPRLISHQRASSLHMANPAKTLKPAAIPLMDSGKALARSGEFLIDVTKGMDLYGGALSATGALLRNCGDCVAQAAASCRFKTGQELVCDELREGASCMLEAELKMKMAVEEAKTDENEDLAMQLKATIPTITSFGQNLESAGEGIMKGRTPAEIGQCLIRCAQEMEILSAQITEYAPDVSESADAGQRMIFASERMREAGYELTGTKPESDKPKGKAWIKG